jgi:hypothetical protein
MLLLLLIVLEVYIGTDNKNIYNDELINTIFRILRINGIFYSYFGIYTKTNNELLFEPKILNGYKYIDKNGV